LLQLLCGRQWRGASGERGVLLKTISIAQRSVVLSPWVEGVEVGGSGCVLKVEKYHLLAVDVREKK
jgi:hypothetical protein